MKKSTVALVACVVILSGLWIVLGSQSVSSGTTPPPPAAAVLPETPAASSPMSAPDPSPSAQLWISSLQLAVEQARDQNKDILLEFTSNGPIGTCSSAETKLDSTEVSRTVSDRFVLVRFDCHPDAAVPQGQSVERDTWAQRLGVASFPFLVVLDKHGRPCGNLDLAACSADALEGSISSLRDRRIQRDAQFAIADRATGPDRAKALHSGLQSVAPCDQEGYLPVMEEILSADPSDQARLRSTYYPIVCRSQIDEVVQHEIYPMVDRRQFGAAVDRLTMLMQEESPPPDQRQLLLTFRGQLYRDNGDNKSALHDLDLAIAAAPDSDQVAQIRTVRDQITQHPAAQK